MTSLPDLKGRLRLSLGDRPPVIREGDFFEVALHVLGVASGFRPRVFIPGWLPDKQTRRAPLRDRVLGACRINPDDPLTYPLTLKGRRYESLDDDRVGLYPVLEWGMYLAQGAEKVKGPKYGGLPLVVRGDIAPKTQKVLEEWKKKGVPDQHPLLRGLIDKGLVHVGAKGALSVTMSGRGPQGSWALTEAGVAMAVRVHNEYVLRDDLPGTDVQPFRKFFTTRNVTCVWLDAQCRYHGLQQKLYDALSGLQQIRKEHEAGTIQEHINTWIGLAIKRDGLRTRLESFDPPTFRQIKDWVLRSVFTTLRSRAQDADTRMTFGALTERERAKGAPATDAVQASSFVRVVQKSEDTDEVVEDLVDTDAHVRSMHEADFGLGMEAISKAFETFRPGNADRLSSIFDKMVEGYDVVEMAEAENVSRNRMASLLGAVRGALRDARQYSGLMVRVLEYLQENPWSTQEDLLEDIKFDEDPEEASKVLVKVLMLLAKGARIRARTFGNGTVGYTTTIAAVRFLASRDETDLLGSMIV